MVNEELRKSWSCFDWLNTRPCDLCGVIFGIGTAGRAKNQYIPASKEDIVVEENIGLTYMGCCQEHLNYAAPITIFEAMSPERLLWYLLSHNFYNTIEYHSKNLDGLKQLLSALHSCQKWVNTVIENLPSKEKKEIISPSERNAYHSNKWRKMDAILNTEGIDFASINADKRFCPICSKETTVSGLTKIVCNPASPDDYPIIEDIPPIRYACCEEHLRLLAYKEFKFVSPGLLIHILSRIIFEEMKYFNLKYLLSALNSCSVVVDNCINNNKEIMFYYHP